MISDEDDDDDEDEDDETEAEDDDVVVDDDDSDDEFEDSGLCAITYSWLTRFMPSRTLVTRHTSATL